MCLNCRGDRNPTLLFPERPVFGTDLWLQAVNAVSIQEDYVSSLERRIDTRRDSGEVTDMMTVSLDLGRQRLLELRRTLKEIDEGG